MPLSIPDIMGSLDEMLDSGLTGHLLTPDLFQMPAPPQVESSARPPGLALRGTATAVIVSVDNANAPKFATVAVLNHSPFEAGYTMPPGFGPFAAGGTAGYNFFYNNSSGVGGSLCKVDLDSRTVINMSGGVSGTAPTPYYKAITDHHHSGNLNPDGYTNPGAVDLSANESMNILPYGQLPLGVQSYINSSGQGLVTQFTAGVIGVDGYITGVNNASTTSTVPLTVGNVVYSEALINSQGSSAGSGVIIGNTTNGYGIYWNGTAVTIQVWKASVTSALFTGTAATVDSNFHSYQIAVAFNGATNTIEATFDGQVLGPVTDASPPTITTPSPIEVKTGTNAGKVSYLVANVGIDLYTTGPSQFRQVINPSGNIIATEFPGQLTGMNSGTYTGLYQQSVVNLKDSAGYPVTAGEWLWTDWNTLNSGSGPLGPTVTDQSAHVVTASISAGSATLKRGATILTTVATALVSDSNLHLWTLGTQYLSAGNYRFILYIDNSVIFDYTDSSAVLTGPLSPGFYAATTGQVYHRSYNFYTSTSINQLATNPNPNTAPAATSITIPTVTAGTNQAAFSQNATFTLDAAGRIPSGWLKKIELMQSKDAGATWTVNTWLTPNTTGVYDGSSAAKTALWQNLALSNPGTTWALGLRYVDIAGNPTPVQNIGNATSNVLNIPQPGRLIPGVPTTTLTAGPGYVFTGPTAYNLTFSCTVSSNANATSVVFWYTNSGSTTPIQTITQPYVAGSTYNVVFGPITISLTQQYDIYMAYADAYGAQTTAVNILGAGVHTSIETGPPAGAGGSMPAGTGTSATLTNSATVGAPGGNILVTGTLTLNANATATWLQAVELTYTPHPFGIITAASLVNATSLVTSQWYPQVPIVGSVLTVGQNVNGVNNIDTVTVSAVSAPTTDPNTGAGIYTLTVGAMAHAHSAYSDSLSATTPGATNLISNTMPVSASTYSAVWEAPPNSDLYVRLLDYNGGTSTPLLVSANITTPRYLLQTNKYGMGANGYLPRVLTPSLPATPTYVNSGGGAYNASVPVTLDSMSTTANPWMRTIEMLTQGTTVSSTTTAAIGAATITAVAGTWLAGMQLIIGSGAGAEYHYIISVSGQVLYLDGPIINTWAAGSAITGTIWQHYGFVAANAVNPVYTLDWVALGGGNSYTLGIRYIDVTGAPSYVVNIATTSSNPIYGGNLQGMPNPATAPVITVAGSYGTPVVAQSTYSVPVSFTLNSIGTAATSWLNQVWVTAGGLVTQVAPTASGAYTVNLGGLSGNTSYPVTVSYFDYAGVQSATASLGTTPAPNAPVTAPSYGNLIVDSDFDFCTYNNGSPNVATSASYWTISATTRNQFARYGSSNTGQNNWQVTAGAANANYVYSQIITLQPGTYTYSAYVDATTCTTTTPQIGMYTTNLAGYITVTSGSANVFQALGSRGRISTTFTVGVTTTCVALLHSNGTVVSSGILDFSIPQLEAGSQMTAYHPGPASTNTGTVPMPVLPPPVNGVINTTPDTNGGYIKPGIIWGRHFHGVANTDYGDMYDNNGDILYGRYDTYVTQSILSDGTQAASSPNLLYNSDFAIGGGTSGIGSGGNSGLVPKFWAPYNNASYSLGFGNDASAGAPFGSAWKITANGATAGNVVGFYTGTGNIDGAPQIYLKANTKYTFSFYAKSTIANTIFSANNNTGVTAAALTGFPINYNDTSWHRYAFVYTVGANDYVGGIFMSTNQSYAINGAVWYAAVQLEEGSVCSVWSGSFKHPGINTTFSDTPGADGSFIASGNIYDRHFNTGGNVYVGGQRAISALDGSNILNAGSLDFSRAYGNKYLDYMNDSGAYSRTRTGGISGGYINNVLDRQGNLAGTAKLTDSAALNISCAGAMPYLSTSTNLHVPAVIIIMRPNGDFCRVNAGTDITVPNTSFGAFYLLWNSGGYAATYGFIAYNDVSYPSFSSRTDIVFFAYCSGDNGLTTVNCPWANSDHISQMQQQFPRVAGAGSQGVRSLNSSFLNKQGSLLNMTGTPSASYTSTTTSITLSVSATTYTFTDNLSTVSAPSYAYAYNALAANTSYHFNIWYDVTNNVFGSTNYGTTAPTAAQTFADCYKDTRLPLATNYIITTPASGTGGGSRPPPGDGSGCPADYQLMQTRDRGLVRADELERGDFIASTKNGGWVVVLNATRLPAPLWRYVVSDGEQTESFDVNDTHALKMLDGGWVKVRDMQVGDTIAGETCELTIVAAHYLYEGHYVAVEVDTHEYSMGKSLVHNPITL